MNRKKNINLIFDDMIDDMKYIKIATFTRKFKLDINIQKE